MKKMILTLEGHHFKRQYLLYIIEIVHENDRHYYVGQTGDRNHITARPAFRRLAGHMEDISSSTQNQIYQYIAEKVFNNKRSAKENSKFDASIKQGVEDFLVSSTLNMYIYPLQPFHLGIDKKEHLENVWKVELFEKIVLSHFLEQKKQIANKKVLSPKNNDECPYPEVLNEIISDFNLQSLGQ